MIRNIAFDCFGTVFDISSLPKGAVSSYARHVRNKDFSPFPFAEEWYALRAHADAAKGIRMLQADGLLCIAMSNGDKGLIRQISEANGILWDGIIDLVAHGTYKPNDGAYDAIEKQFGLPPGETLMVTANPTFGDLEGSAKIGMPSQVIRHPGTPADIIALVDTVRAMRQDEPDRSKI